LAWRSLTQRAMQQSSGFDANELSLRTWKQDLTSGFLVFLIALPLCLGIAMASGFPPIAGILTAIVGGILGTVLGSARLTIKGPAAGLIVIALGAVTELSDPVDPTLGYKRALAVGVVAGLLQIGLAAVRAGSLGDAFPPSAVHGMLAAIGVIIISKQAHTAMGVKPMAKEPLGLLAEIPHSFMNMNPEIFVIGAVSLIILFGMPKLPFKWAKKVPAPMVVVAIAIVLEHIFDLEHDHTYSWHGHNYPVGPTYLVTLPGQLLNAIALPDFGVVFSGPSIKYIVMFLLVGSLESLLSAKAVDQLDPEHRHQDLNRDLLATGVANTVAAFIGGLPMISEIVRGSANINSGAKSRMSNFFHGVFLLLFVLLLPGLLHQIPLAALGAMLIYTGLRLASPAEFVKTFRIGADQLAVFTTTLVVTLATDLLIGVMSGVLLEVIIHLGRGASPASLFKTHAESSDAEGQTVLKVSKSALFTNYIGLKKRIETLSISVDTLVLDFGNTQLVDHTVLEKLHHQVLEWQRVGKSLTIVGLDDHKTASAHEAAARWKARAPSPASVS
jgi:MFS superfamily sulfate permease-like transporter